MLYLAISYAIILTVEVLLLAHAHDTLANAHNTLVDAHNKLVKRIDDLENLPSKDWGNDYSPF